MRKALVGGAAVVREGGRALDGAQHTDAQMVQMCRDRQSRTKKGNSSNCPTLGRPVRRWDLGPQ